MKKIWSIYRKEMLVYLASPTAYIFITMFLVMTGYFFWFILIDSREASMRGTFGIIGSVLLFVSPMLTMRLLAEEKKSGTIELLFTSPIQNTELVLGKFFASLSLFLVMFSATLIYPIILYALGSPDFWPLVSGYIGLILMAGCYTSVGLLASALTENQLIAGIISFAVLLVVLILDWLKNFISNPFLIDLIKKFSFFEHYENFGKGIIALPDIVYFLSFIFVTLFICVRALEIQRTR